MEIMSTIIVWLYAIIAGASRLGAFYKNGVEFAAWTMFVAFAKGLYVPAVWGLLCWILARDQWKWSSIAYDLAGIGFIDWTMQNRLVNGLEFLERFSADREWTTEPSWQWEDMAPCLFYLLCPATIVSCFLRVFRWWKSSARYGPSDGPVPWSNEMAPEPPVDPNRPSQPKDSRGPDLPEAKLPWTTGAQVPPPETPCPSVPMPEDGPVRPFSRRERRIEASKAAQVKSAKRASTETTPPRRPPSPPKTPRATVPTMPKDGPVSVPSRRAIRIAATSRAALASPCPVSAGLFPTTKTTTATTMTKPAVVDLVREDDNNDDAANNANPLPDGGWISDAMLRYILAIANGEIIPADSSTDDGNADFSRRPRLAAAAFAPATPPPATLPGGQVGIAVGSDAVGHEQEQQHVTEDDEQQMGQLEWVPVVMEMPTTSALVVRGWAASEGQPPVEGTSEGVVTFSECLAGEPVLTEGQPPMEGKPEEGAVPESRPLWFADRPRAKQPRAASPEGRSDPREVKRLRPEVVSPVIMGFMPCDDQPPRTTGAPLPPLAPAQGAGVVAVVPSEMDIDVVVSGPEVDAEASVVWFEDSVMTDYDDSIVAAQSFVVGDDSEMTGCDVQSPLPSASAPPLHQYSHPDQFCSSVTSQQALVGHEQSQQQQQQKYDPMDEDSPMSEPISLAVAPGVFPAAHAEMDMDMQDAVPIEAAPIPVVTDIELPGANLPDVFLPAPAPAPPPAQAAVVARTATGPDTSVIVAMSDPQDSAPPLAPAILPRLIETPVIALTPTIPSSHQYDQAKAAAQLPDSIRFDFSKRSLNFGYQMETLVTRFKYWSLHDDPWPPAPAPRAIPLARRSPPTGRQDRAVVNGSKDKDATRDTQRPAMAERSAPVPKELDTTLCIAVCVPLPGDEDEDELDGEEHTSYEVPRQLEGEDEQSQIEEMTSILLAAVTSPSEGDESGEEDSEMDIVLSAAPNPMPPVGDDESEYIAAQEPVPETDPEDGERKRRQEGEESSNGGDEGDSDNESQGSQEMDFSDSEEETVIILQRPGPSSFPATANTTATATATATAPANANATSIPESNDRAESPEDVAPALPPTCLPAFS